MDDHSNYSIMQIDSDDDVNSLQFNSEVQFDTEEQRDFKELLIVLVKNYPHLYDKKNANFKDAMMKNNSWDEIGRVLNLSGMECQNYWKRLRERYSREKKIIEEGFRSGKEASNRKVWCHYKNLDFLKPFVSGRKTHSNLGPAKSEASTAEIQSKDQVHQVEKSNGGPEKSNEASESDILSENTENERPDTSCIGRARVPTKKRSRPSDQVDLSIMNLTAAVTSHLTKKAHADSDEVFGALIANELRNLTDFEITNRKKREIMKIIYE